jgi:tetratricopeptide (TPR) repeat protein
VLRSIQDILRGILMVILLLFVVQWQQAAAQSKNAQEEAYEHNRQGMIAMSQAEFEEAIAEFQKAAALSGDYQITGRPLIYTPVFMTAWAQEKIGRIEDACRSFRRFLQIALTEASEKTKVDHAREYIAQQCRKSK